MDNSSRRYDIDWLRILVFGWLILYHIGMYYVADWNWHLKSHSQSEFLQNIMLWSNPWRMSLLFLLSGAALRLVEKNVSSYQLAKARFIRVLIPLIIGMYIVVPPQLYFELHSNAGYTSTYGQFLLMYINPNTAEFSQYQYGDLGLLTWNHLWFLAYLFVYTALYLASKPIIAYAANRVDKFEKLTNLWLIIPIFILAFIALKLETIYPQTNGLFSDWYNHARYLFVFSIGYFIANNNAFWLYLLNVRRVLLTVAFCCYSLILLGHNQLLPLWVHETRWLVEAVEACNTWAWICTLLAYAHRYLNKPSTMVRKLNEAILPCYILHQTIIIFIVVWLQAWQLPIALEGIVVIVVTAAVCMISYRLVSTSNLSRFMLGMKLKSSKS